MEKTQQLYEGKAKRVFATKEPDYVSVSYKDDATAFDGKKKGSIAGKGAVNNKMSNFFMQALERNGIPTHFVQQLNDRESLVKKVGIIPLEVIVRNIAAGHFSSRYGVEEGLVFDEPIVEFSYKNDELHDPLLNDDHAVALKIATREEIAQIRSSALQINTILKEMLLAVGVTLVDFKLEFGRLPGGEILLADEISPDTCRFWDTATGKKLDKDRFRRDLGGAEDAYLEMERRLLGDHGSAAEE